MSARDAIRRQLTTTRTRAWTVAASTIGAIVIVVWLMTPGFGPPPAYWNKADREARRIWELLHANEEVVRNTIADQSLEELAVVIGDTDLIGAVGKDWVIYRPAQGSDIRQRGSEIGAWAAIWREKFEVRYYHDVQDIPHYIQLATE